MKKPFKLFFSILNFLLKVDIMQKNEKSNQVPAKVKHHLKCRLNRKKNGLKPGSREMLRLTQDFWSNLGCLT